jgi:Fatty acid hydroxylase superfamily
VPALAISSLAASLPGWLLTFLVWFLIWTPLVALLEYATHRWIMHQANRLLDPRLDQLKAHVTHHQGSNDDEFVNMPLKNCLLLSIPVILLLVGWGLVSGSLASIVIPAAAFLSWSFVYTYLWTRIHRAIHGVENNWFRRIGPAFRFFRNHHLRHHVHANANYGTVFPLTDYLFFTWHGRSVGPRNWHRRRRGQPKRAEA